MLLFSPSLRPAFPPLQAARREAEIDRASEKDKGHGRKEKRTIEVTSTLGEYLRPDWEGCAQVFRLTRERKIGEKVETQVIHGITSLDRERVSPKGLLGFTRAHWGIENGLHGVRDGTLREDAGRLRKGSAAEVMATLRNIVIFLSNRLGHKSAASAPWLGEIQPDLAEHTAVVASNTGDRVVDENLSATDRQGAESPLREPARVDMPRTANRASQPITRKPDSEMDLPLSKNGTHVFVALEHVGVVQKTRGHVGSLLGVVLHKPKGSQYVRRKNHY